MTQTTSGLPAAARSQGRVVQSLAAVIFLQWLATSLVLPLLPDFLLRRGASGAMIGLAMAAFFLGALAAQYPLGKLTDRVAPRTVLIAAVVGYALSAAVLLVAVPSAALVGIRAAQGAAAGATEVVALTVIGHRLPTTRRTGGYAAVFAAQTAGLAIGPLLAGAAGTGRMSLLFLLATVAGALACIPLLHRYHALGADVPAAPVKLGSLDERPAPLRKIRALHPVFAAAAVTGLISGVYEACWTLLLDHRGATSWQVGLSWSLFCIPFIAVSALAGRLTSHLNPWLIRAVGLGCSTLLLAVYPFITSIPIIIALGAVEGAATALAYPAVQTLLAQHTPAGRLGHAQGTFATMQTACTGLAAAAGGVLFTVAAWLPFATAAAASAAALTFVRGTARRRLA